MTPIKPPTWFWVLAIVGLIWNILGILSFIMHITISPETLGAMPEQERALYTGFPTWVLVTFCIAVFGSTIANILLLLRNAIATPLFVTSFIAILLQMVYTIFISNAIAVHGPAALGVPTLVVIFGAVLLWLSSTAKSRGWIS